MYYDYFEGEYMDNTKQDIFEIGTETSYFDTTFTAEEIVDFLSQIPELSECNICLRNNKDDMPEFVIDGMVYSFLKDEECG